MVTPSGAHVKQDIQNRIATIEFFHSQHIKYIGEQPVAVRYFKKLI